MHGTDIRDQLNAGCYPDRRSKRSIIYAKCLVLAGLLTPAALLALLALLALAALVALAALGATTTTSYECMVISTGSICFRLGRRHYTVCTQNIKNIR
jgi:hypothetical protein